MFVLRSSASKDSGRFPPSATSAGARLFAGCERGKGLDPSASFRLRPAVASDAPAISACVNNVAVLPELKGRGIGRALLMHAEDEARARGHASLYLYTNEKMAENIAMYVRNGYVEYAREEGHGFRRVFLRKQLEEPG